LFIRDSANNTKTGGVARALIYPKGAFVLHMIRMMMWNRHTGDQAFKEMMHDFTSTYANRTASTEDFKMMVEKHLPDELKFTGGKLDWFFDEWVDGTALPSYRLESSYEKDANGDEVLNAKITQSNVDAAFLMPVPIYVELADGRMVRVAQAPMLGNITREFKIPLTGLKEAPKRALLNAYDDVLTGNP
jgi:aminopeptidase N